MLAVVSFKLLGYVYVDIISASCLYLKTFPCQYPQALLKLCYVTVFSI